VSGKLLEKTTARRCRDQLFRETHGEVNLHGRRKRRARRETRRGSQRGVRERNLDGGKNLTSRRGGGKSFEQNGPNELPTVNREKHLFLVKGALSVGRSEVRPSSPSGRKAKRNSANKTIRAETPVSTKAGKLMRQHSLRGRGPGPVRAEAY